MKQQVTKRAIEQSLIELLKEKYFDKIRVQEIVDKCDVTRNTFYYYYNDIYDVFEDILNRNIKNAIENHNENNSCLAKLLVSGIDYLAANPEMTEHIFKSNKQEELLPFIDRTVWIAVEYYVNVYSKGKNISKSDREIIIKFNAYAIAGMFRMWVVRGMDYDLEAEILRAGGIFRDEIRSAVERAHMDN